VRKKDGKRLSMIISYEIENVEKMENLTKKITKVRKAF
jgi:hypothetical protein